MWGQVILLTARGFTGMTTDAIISGKMKAVLFITIWIITDTFIAIDLETDAFSLATLFNEINVIAVDSLRNLPISAEYGFSLVFFYVVAALFFFIPIALISAELATGWPKTGGIYVWVREAFGTKTAFFTIWLQWIYNIVWYPTILAFLAATITYLIDPQLFL